MCSVPSQCSRMTRTARAVRLMREHCEGTEHILAALMPD